MNEENRVLQVYKNSRRRSHVELLIDTLSAMKSESQPTRIMYTTNLSWISLRAILRTLERQGAAAKDVCPNDKEVWHLTTRGREALNTWDKLMRSFLD